MIKDLTKTVYSMCLPETKNVFDKLLDNKDQLHNMYSETFTKKQDSYHVSYLEAFKKWSSPVLEVDWNDFKHSYPCAGASEAIREQIAHLRSIGKETMYIFGGEYEGYEAIATPLGFNVIKIDRDDYKKIDYIDNSVFFVSNPSSIDGNVWKDFDKFIKHMDDEFSSVDLYIDVTYIGAIPFDFKINAKYKNVQGIFFSLSKSFGVYYHRIGGCFLKEANPLLYGNMWFKNVLSMKYGEDLMNQLPIVDLAKKYEHYQNKAISKIEKKYGLSYISKSDVFLLVNLDLKKFAEEINDQDVVDYISDTFKRDSKDVIRLCLTPIIEKMISEDMKGMVVA